MTTNLSLPPRRRFNESLLLPSSLKTYESLHLLDVSKLDMSLTPLIRVSDSHPVRLLPPPEVIRSPSSIDIPPPPSLKLTDHNIRRKLQKNCSECTRAHRRCVFPSIGKLACTRCMKMHLQCTFLYSDQGRRNDLISTRQVGLPFTLRTIAAGTRSCMRRLAFYQSAVPSKNIASERDHCNPLTQCSTVSSGFRCHTRNTLMESEQTVEKTSRTTSPKVFCHNELRLLIYVMPCLKEIDER